jgi:hypothetical protein
VRHAVTTKYARGDKKVRAFFPAIPLLFPRDRDRVAPGLVQGGLDLRPRLVLDPRVQAGLVRLDGHQVLRAGPADRPRGLAVRVHGVQSQHATGNCHVLHQLPHRWDLIGPRIDAPPTEHGAPVMGQCGHQMGPSCLVPGARATGRLRTAVGAALGDTARSVLKVADSFGVSRPTAHRAFVAHAEGCEVGVAARCLRVGPP